MFYMMEELYNYDFLYPGDSVRPVGEGEGYVDYLFTKVLACYGCVIRDLWLNYTMAVVIVYKCLDGKRVKGYQFSIPPVTPDMKLDAYLRHYLRRFRHARDLIIRYPIKDDGSLGYPMWHTIFSGIYETFSYKDWRYSLLSDPETQFSSVLKDYSCCKSADKVDTTCGRMIDVIAALRYNGFDANPLANEIVFNAFGHRYSIHVHDDVLALEGLFYCPSGEPVNLENLSKASNRVWIGGAVFDYGADLSNFPARFLYEFQDNEKGLGSLGRLIPQMAENMHNAFNGMMKIYKETSKTE